MSDIQKQFKVGDKVRCVDGLFNKNKEYTVESIGVSGITIALKGEGTTFWSMRRFDYTKNHIVTSILNDL